MGMRVQVARAYLYSESLPGCTEACVGWRVGLVACVVQVRLRARAGCFGFGGTLGVGVRDCIVQADAFCFV